jgi:hypothetical protein
MDFAGDDASKHGLVVERPIMMVRTDSPTRSNCYEGLDQLEAHIQAKLAGQVRELRLEVCGNGLVLRGRCHTYYAKQLAQHAVLSARPELPIVANEIVVA